MSRLSSPNFIKLAWRHPRLLSPQQPIAMLRYLIPAFALMLSAPVAALRLPAARTAAFAPTRHSLAPRHASTCMAEEAEDMQVDDFLALATPEELEQARKDKEARLQERGARLFQLKTPPAPVAAGEGDTPEELELARQEKEIRLARIAAVNKGQVTAGASLPGKAFTVVLLAGVAAALVLVVGDPQNCEFLPTTKDVCMARPAEAQPGP